MRYCFSCLHMKKQKQCQISLLLLYIISCNVFAQVLCNLEAPITKILGMPCIEKKLEEIIAGAQPEFFKGGVTLCRKLKKGLFSYGQDITMAFQPSVVGCLVKKGLQKEGGEGVICINFTAVFKIRCKFVVHTEQIWAQTIQRIGGSVSQYHDPLLPHTQIFLSTQERSVINDIAKFKSANQNFKCELNVWYSLFISGLKATENCACIIAHHMCSVHCFVVTQIHCSVDYTTYLPEAIATKHC